MNSKIHCWNNKNRKQTDNQNKPTKQKKGERELTFKEDILLKNKTKQKLPKQTNKTKLKRRELTFKEDTMLNNEPNQTHTTKQTKQKRRELTFFMLPGTSINSSSEPMLRGSLKTPYGSNTKHKSSNFCLWHNMHKNSNHDSIQVYV